VSEILVNPMNKFLRRMLRGGLENLPIARVISLEKAEQKRQDRPLRNYQMQDNTYCGNIAIVGRPNLV